MQSQNWDDSMQLILRLFYQGPVYLGYVVLLGQGVLRVDANSRAPLRPKIEYLRAELTFRLIFNQTNLADFP